jgi:uncharacterized protein YbjT (DUF2867 family)
VATTILVTGGTGALGRHVVRRALEAGHEVRVVSRRPRPDRDPGYRWATVDWATGDGLDAALRGADAVVHCAGEPRSTAVDEALVAAARRAGGSPHLVYISIVGVDRIPYFYYRTKLAAEGIVAGSGLPWTVLRATQFHDLIGRTYDVLSRSPVVPVPAGVRVQPVETREVADRLLELAGGEPAGRADDMGGPAVRDAGELVRLYLRARGRRRAVLPVWLPGTAFQGFRRGYHLAPAHPVGRGTFEEYLAAEVPGAHTA